MIAFGGEISDLIIAPAYDNSYNFYCFFFCSKLIFQLTVLSFKNIEI